MPFVFSLSAWLMLVDPVLLGCLPFHISAHARCANFHCLQGLIPLSYGLARLLVRLLLQNVLRVGVEARGLVVFAFVLVFGVVELLEPVSRLDSEDHTVRL